jgi:hypothetical protein
MIAAADFRRECDGSEVAGGCADGSDAPEAGRGAAERVMATVDAFEAQLYGPTKKTAERQQAKAAEPAAKEPEK